MNTTLYDIKEFFRVNKVVIKFNSNDELSMLHSYFGIQTTKFPCFNLLESGFVNYSELENETIVSIYLVSDIDSNYVEFEFNEFFAIVSPHFRHFERFLNL